MKKVVFNFFILLAASFLLAGCAGTIKTVSYTTNEIGNFKRAYVVSEATSDFIQTKAGFILPLGVYIVLPDEPPVRRHVIGNTGYVIKQELMKYGINTELVSKGDSVKEFDLLVLYHDVWRWDFKKVLDKLEITFILPDGTILSKSTFNIYKNKELDNYPTPEKEVPKMLKELLHK